MSEIPFMDKNYNEKMSPSKKQLAHHQSISNLPFKKLPKSKKDDIRNSNKKKFEMT